MEVRADDDVADEEMLTLSVPVTEEVEECVLVGVTVPERDDDVVTDAVDVTVDVSEARAEAVALVV